jgi:hypothetical protein
MKLLVCKVAVPFQEFPCIEFNAFFQSFFFYDMFILFLILLLLALPTKSKDIVFRFIIEYSSLRDFYWPLDNNNRSIFI